MNIQDIHLLYEYNYWADKRILDQCENVAQEQFIAPAEFPYGGLRGTTVHILDAEFSWRMLLQKDDWSVPELKETEFPTLASVRERWDAEEREMRAYLAALHDEDMNVHSRYQTPEGELRDRVLWHYLVHVVNHGTQHRSEAAALLTRFGRSPGDLDLTVFLNGYKP